MNYIPEDIRNIAMENPSVMTAIRIHETSGLSWEKTLESLVVVLAKQNKELQDLAIKQAELSISPKKFYVNMSKGEIERLKEKGEIKLSKPIYEDSE